MKGELPKTSVRGGLSHEDQDGKSKSGGGGWGQVGAAHPLSKKAEPVGADQAGRLAAGGWVLLAMWWCLGGWGLCWLGNIGRSLGSAENPLEICGLGTLATSKAWP